MAYKNALDTFNNPFGPAAAKPATYYTPGVQAPATPAASANPFGGATGAGVMASGAALAPISIATGGTSFIAAAIITTIGSLIGAFAAPKPVLTPEQQFFEDQVKRFTKWRQKKEAVLSSISILSGIPVKNLPASNSRYDWSKDASLGVTPAESTGRDTTDGRLPVTPNEPTALTSTEGTSPSVRGSTPSVRATRAVEPSTTNPPEASPTITHETTTAPSGRTNSITAIGETRKGSAGRKRR